EGISGEPDYVNYESINRNLLDKEQVKIDDADYVIDEPLQRRHHDIKRTIDDAEEKQFIQTEIESLSLTIKYDINEYLDKIQDQDYDAHFLWNIKEIFDKKIKEFDDQPKKYNLSIKFKVKMFSHYLLNAVDHFERMQKKYRDKNDLKKLVDRVYKLPTYAIFMGIFTRCKKENIAANILCDSLENAILTSVKELLPQNIYDALKNKDEFNSKLRLIEKVMYDLKIERSFKYYIEYIENTANSLESWVEKYVQNYCSKEKNYQTMLGAEANKIFNNKVESLIMCIDEVLVNSTIKFKEWLKEFNNNAKNIIPLTDTFLNLFGMAEVEVKDIEYFKIEIKKNLRRLQQSYGNILNAWGVQELDSLKEKPYKMISKTLLGCKKQCPFCNVICSWTLDHPGKKHKAERHYPAGIAGFCWPKSKELILDSCNENIASDKYFRCAHTNFKNVKYKEYKSVNNYYRSWIIESDVSYEATAYWNWVFANFSKDFAEHYGLKCSKIPSKWKNLKEEYVENSIKR
ncbi:unnamed protein product, partial [Meganyctiphanes norvegica]